MKTSSILFVIFLFKNFPAQDFLSTPMISLEITDCGDGKYASFVTSITPNPLLWVGSSDSTFWIGGRFSFTKEANIFASNMSIRDLARDMQAYYILEESTSPSIAIILKSILEQFNSTFACHTFMTREYCATIHQAMISKLTNSTFFASFEFGVNQLAVDREIINYVLNLVQVKIQLQIKLALYGHTLFCFQFAINTAHYSDTTGNDKEYIGKNIQHAFDTPKIMSHFNQNETFSCPENSMEINNSSCECNPPFSGPLCSFQCRYDNIKWSDCANWPNESTFMCTFEDQDYIQYCIEDNNVQFLNSSITVDIVSLNHINIKWKLINFLASYNYVLALQDNTGTFGSIAYTALNFNGLESSYSLGSLCLQKTVYGVDCRNATIDGQVCFNCPDLSLKPFHDYSIALKLGVGNAKDNSDLAEYVTTTINFTTPEVDVLTPKITSAALDKDQNHVSVDWMLTDKYCPGCIRRYELTISCNSDQAIASGNLHFDCRSGFQGPKLNGTVPVNCKREDIDLKLRIGTANSTSDESEQFLLKNEALSTLAIIAYVFGAFLIAAAIASVIFYYYYKRHVKTFQNAHQAVRNLLHIQRKSGVGQSFRARSAPNLPIPDIPEGCNSPGGTTAYQTIVATSEVGSPHSLQVPERKNETDSNIPPDYAGYTTPEFQ